MPPVHRNVPDLGQGFEVFEWSVRNLKHVILICKKSASNRGEDIPRLGNRVPILGEEIPTPENYALNLGQIIPTSGNDASV